MKKIASILLVLMLLLSCISAMAETFEGVGTGNGGDIKVAITVEDGKITAIEVLEQNEKYLGYGYLDSPEELIPNVPLVYWSFRLMIGFGMVGILLFILAFIALHKDKLQDWKWLLWLGIITIPMAYLSGQFGWVVAEVGRQPWTIQGLLPVKAAISSLSVGAVKTTFFVFLGVFALFLVIEIRIMIQAFKKGPEIDEAVPVVPNNE